MSLQLQHQVYLTGNMIVEVIAVKVHVDHDTNRSAECRVTALHTVTNCRCVVSIRTATFSASVWCWGHFSPGHIRLQKRINLLLTSI